MPKLKLKKLVGQFYLLLGLICMLLSVNLFGTHQAALACSGSTTPAKWIPPTLQERVRAAHTVLEGTVTQVVSGYVVVEVQRYFKNSGTDKVKITGFRTPLGGSICNEEIGLGEHAIIFIKDQQDDLYYIQTGPPSLVVSGIGYNQKEVATPEFIAKLLEATGDKSAVAATVNQRAINQAAIAIRNFWCKYLPLIAC